MIRTKIILFILLYAATGQAQNYFQQELDYTITTEFIDSTHRLESKMIINYTHKGAEPLTEIYFHLWANAFKDNTSYYAEDQLRRGSRDFYFADEEDKGGYEALSIEMDGKAYTYEAVNGYDDVIKVVLDTPLASSQSKTINIEFDLKMPSIFSRLGRQGDNYHFTHWYPRVAVYDEDGWHPIHYGLGEFYGEYASYNVFLKVPADYRIAFTGKGIASLPTSMENGTSTWAITAENVHDFAWVASKDYITDFDKVKSIDGRDISLTVLRREDYKPHWSKALELLKESLSYYESAVGPYAYDKIVLVQDVPGGDLNMEYPGLIIVGDRGNEQSLDYYINHELGHQWFYGALGFNEHKEPWLDEGLTTFYEHRYTERKYGISHYGSLAESYFKSRRGLEPLHAAISAHQGCRCHQRADTPLAEMSSYNYGIRSYEMPARYYVYLQNYLGREIYDEGVKSFYAKWKFKHPSTDDLQQHMEEISGKQLDWFFKELLVTDELIDYKIKNITVDGSQPKVTLQNKSNYNVPVYLSYVKDGNSIGGKWVEPFSGTTEVIIDSNIDQVSVDMDNLLFDINRNDNQIKTTGLFKKLEPFRISGVNSTDPSEETNIFLAPSMAFNTVDGYQLGLGILNSTLPPHNLQFEAFAKYGFRSKAPVGRARLAYDQYTDGGRFRMLQYSLEYKTHHFRNFRFQESDFIRNLRYQRIVPQVKAVFNHRIASGVSSEMSLRNIRLYEEAVTFDGQFPSGTENNSTDIQELSYARKKRNALTTNEISLALEHQAYEDIFDPELTKRYLKLTATGSKKVFFQKDRSVEVRVFGSVFLHNTERESSSFNSILTRGSIPFFAQGHNDYRYDEKFVERADQDAPTFFIDQVGHHGGGFKNTINSGFSNIGNSNNYAVAANLSFHPPIKLPSFLKPIRIFLDAGVYSSRATNLGEFSDTFLYSAGLTYDLDFLKIHFPLIQSSLIDSAYGPEDGFFQKITFSIDIPRFDYGGFTDFLDL
jgi:hypothetical protein